MTITIPNSLLIFIISIILLSTTSALPEQVLITPAITNVNGNSNNGGSGGGSGGGLSSEAFSNIEFRESQLRYIYYDKISPYIFTTTNNPISFINIIGNVNFGDVTTTVEVLKSRSTLSTKEPPGTVYKYINIWAGTSAFNTARNIKNAAIGFRVTNSWLAEQESTDGQIRIAHWTGTDWKILDTTKMSIDDTYTYFETITDTFSLFAIIKAEPPAPFLASSTQPDKLEVITIDLQPVDIEPTPQNTEYPVPMPMTPAIGTEYSILVLITTYILKKVQKI